MFAPRGCLAQRTSDIVRVTPERGLAAMFPASDAEGADLPATWHAACAIPSRKSRRVRPLEKITLQFFKEYPRKQLPASLEHLRASKSSNPKPR